MASFLRRIDSEEERDQVNEEINKYNQTHHDNGYDNQQQEGIGEAITDGTNNQGINDDDQLNENPLPSTSMSNSQNAGDGASAHPSLAQTEAISVRDVTKKKSKKKKGELDKNGNPIYNPPDGWERVRSLGNYAINASIVGQWSSLLFIPAVYSALTDALGFSASALGAIHTARLLAMFFSLPVYAVLCYLFSRRLILSITLALAGVFTILNAATFDYASFMIVNIIAGLFLGAIVPVSRSIIPNYYALFERGEYFGYLELSAGIGGFVGAGIGVAITRYGYPIGAAKVAFEQEMAKRGLTWESPPDKLHNITTATPGICCYGWQSVYIFEGLLMFPLALYTYFYLTDPVMDRRKISQLDTENLLRVFPGLKSGYRMPTVKELVRLFAKGTYACIVLQGCFGAFPWSGMSFLILWLQRMGTEEILAVVIFAFIGIGAAVGGLIGGVLGDICSRSKFLGEKFGRVYGRVFVSHISVVFGIIYAPCLLQLIPYQASSWWVFAIVGGLMGVSIAWPPANNSAIQSDIFPQFIHPTSFAVQYWVEGSIASFSPFVVGLLNDYAFGAKDLAPPGGQVEWDSYPPERQQAALQGMADSLSTVTAVMWFICSLFYCGMYYFYPHESHSLNPHKFDNDNYQEPINVSNEGNIKKEGESNNGIEDAPSADIPNPPTSKVSIMQEQNQDIVEV